MNIKQITLIVLLLCGFFKQENTQINEVKAILKNKYFQGLTEEQVQKNAIKGMVENLDEFSAFIDEDDFKSLEEGMNGEFVGIGVEISKKASEDFVKIISPIKDSPAFHAGLKPDDMIVEIDGKRLEKLSTFDVSKLVKGVKGTIVKLKIIRDSKILDFAIKRNSIKTSTVKSSIENNNFIIEISSFNKNTYNEMKNTLKTYNVEKNNIKNIVVDLRYNPGGLLDSVVDVSGMFLKKDQKIVSIKGKNGVLMDDFKATKNGIFSDKNIIVLINKGSASASEIFAGAIKDNKRGTLIGSKTYGKGSVQEVLNLSGIKNSAIKITIAKYFTPNDVCIDKIGIEPDKLMEKIDYKTLSN